MYYYIGDITYEQASAYLLNERETFLRVRLSKRQADFNITSRAIATILVHKVVSTSYAN